MKKILAIVLMMALVAVLACTAFASGEPSGAPATDAAADTEQVPVFEWRVIKEATATEDGVKGLYGTADGTLYITDVIPATGAEAAPAEAPASEEPAPQQDASAEPTRQASEEPAQQASEEPASAEPAQQDASAEPASEEPAAEEAPAEEAAIQNPNYDYAAHNWASIELVLAIVIIVVGAILMLSFGKKKDY